MESKRIEELRVRQSSFIAAFVKISWLCFCDRVARWRVCLKVGQAGWQHLAPTETKRTHVAQLQAF